MINKYSGIFSILSTWIFVVGASVIAGYNKKLTTITRATYDDKLKKVINLGLMLGAFFQVLFLRYIIDKFSLGLTDLGVILYATTMIDVILVAIFVEKKFKKVHVFCSYYYFLINPISLTLIGSSLVDKVPVFAIFSVSISLVYFSVIYILWKKFKTSNAYMQYLEFLLFSVWTLVVTFINY